MPVTHCLRCLFRQQWKQFTTGVTTNSATATNCVSLYDLRGIH